EVVADEVDDHHVLGAVLGRALELRALAGGERWIARPRARALDRRAADTPPVKLEAQLWRQAGERTRRSAQEGGAVGPEGCRAGGEEIYRLALQARVEPNADVGLEQVPGVDPLATRVDGHRVAGGGRGGPPRRRAERPRLRRRFGAFA